MADDAKREADRLAELVERVRSKGGDEAMVGRLVGLQAKLRTPPPSEPSTLVGESIPEPTPPGSPKKLTIGMACYADFDGVFFSVQALRFYHPEVTADTEILVVDNGPTRPEAWPLKHMENSVENYRYIPAGDVRGTAIRDRIFHEATSEWVIVIDSHVFLAPGSIARFLEFIDEHPESGDLYQGPLVGSDNVQATTHMDPKWNAGMYGVWGVDDRGLDPDAEPFEIPMHGLGMFACRREAWPGFNPRFRGFGGEEGYIHEKFRSRGNETICLPFLRWLHRFERPTGPVYEVRWADRIRNYMIGFDEVGLDRQPIIDHFGELLGAEACDPIVAQVESELASPFHFFDAIFCMSLDSRPDRWERMQQRFEALGIADRVERFPAIETPALHHIGCALSHRRIVELAAARGLDNVLVFEDDATFRRDGPEILSAALSELSTQPDWKILYLGAMNWGDPRDPLPGCTYLRDGHELTESHAIAYNASFFEELLEVIPADAEGVARWLDSGIPAIDQWFSTGVDGPKFLIEPQISYQEARLKYIDADEAASYR